MPAQVCSQPWNHWNSTHGHMFQHRKGVQVHLGPQSHTDQGGRQGLIPTFSEQFRGRRSTQALHTIPESHKDTQDLLFFAIHPLGLKPMIKYSLECVTWSCEPHNTSWDRAGLWALISQPMPQATYLKSHHVMAWT